MASGVSAKITCQLSHWDSFPDGFFMDSAETLEWGHERNPLPTADARRVISDTAQLNLKSRHQSTKGQDHCEGSCLTQ